MIINREFFFRGWLPAGLVVNARLLSSSSDDGTAVLKPIINPAKGAGWPDHQPAPVFPIEQADGESAIVLVDEFPEGALVMLPLGQWYGSGTPFILGINTWYEGRIRVVSGSDVMAVRLIANQRRFYYSSAGSGPGVPATPDVCVTAMPAKFIGGSGTSRDVFLDVNEITRALEMGCAPKTIYESYPYDSWPMQYLQLLPVHVAGMRVGFEDKSSGGERAYVQCQVVDGIVEGGPSTSYAFVGIIPVAIATIQPFYRLYQGDISEALSNKNLLDPESEQVIGVAIHHGGDGVIDYN